MDELLTASKEEDPRGIGATVAEIAMNKRSTEKDIERTGLALSEIRKIWEDNICHDDETLDVAADILEHRLRTERSRHDRDRNDVCVEPTVASDIFTYRSLPQDVQEYPRAYRTMTLQELERERHALTVQKGHRLNKRYMHPRGSTTIGILGTSLAVGQLVATLACVVM
jgi:hypothetical protein